MPPAIQKKTCFFEGSTTLPDYPSDKISFKQDEFGALVEGLTE
jgi:hypothetical protein